MRVLLIVLNHVTPVTKHIYVQIFTVLGSQTMTTQQMLLSYQKVVAQLAYAENQLRYRTSVGS